MPPRTHKTAADKPKDKPLVWLHGEVKTPPFSPDARIEAGFLLRQLQQGVRLSLPHSRPMPSIGASCHELRLPDRAANWRIVYRMDADAVVILEVFSKKTEKTPPQVIATCKQRLALYDAATKPTAKIKAPATRKKTTK